jgi:ankyrin repeat protein
MELHSAVAAGAARRVQQLLARGADANAPDSLGMPPLLSVAMASGQHESDATVAQLLLAAGARLEAHTERGWTPLFAAVQTGKHDVLRVLLAAGADADAAPRGAGRTALATHYRTVELAWSTFRASLGPRETARKLTGQSLCFLLFSSRN